MRRLFTFHDYLIHFPKTQSIFHIKGHPIQVSRTPIVEKGLGNKDYEDKKNREQLNLDLKSLRLQYSEKHPRGSLFHNVKFILTIENRGNVRELTPWSENGVSLGKILERVNRIYHEIASACR